MSVKTPEELFQALGSMGAEIKHIKESGDRTESEVKSTVSRMVEEVRGQMASAKIAAVDAAIEAAGDELRHCLDRLSSHGLSPAHLRVLAGIVIGRYHLHLAALEA